MRKSIVILLLALTCFAAATIKDPRKLTPVAPLSQPEVARQQALQHGQGTVGLVPDKTNGSGYAPRSDNDSAATNIVASHDGAISGSAEGDILKNNEERNAEDERPRKTAFGAFWALFVGLLLAFAAWAGLQKYGPKPPAHLS